MSASQFNDQSLFGGGGFMQSQATQATETNLSTGKKNSSQFLPLTVKQIAGGSYNNSSFTIDGIEVSNVTLLGIVTNKMERVTDVSFHLDDGTGKIEVYRWVNDAVESNEMASIEHGQYVRVCGHLKNFQGKTTISSFSVRSVTDFNEVPYHFLECIYVHLYNTKSQGGGPTQLQTNSMSAGFQNGSMVHQAGTGYQNSNMGHQANVPNQFSGRPAMVGSEQDINKRVQYIFEEPASLSIEQGLHVDEVVRRLPGVPKRRIEEAIEFLAGEGLIYSTIDDYHFKSTQNG